LLLVFRSARALMWAGTGCRADHPGVCV